MLRKYFMGIDAGTDSVGYAVTDLDYNLLKYKGEPMWGTHLFEAASLNDERRRFRTARRRLDRRQNRVQLVQEIFAKEISKVDEKFYFRIKESYLWREEATDAYSLFSDESYTDKEYHAQYPTIHHLIYELISDDKPHDVRLVYLACAWLVAHRGHFLNEVSKENIADLLNFEKLYDEFLNVFGTDIPWECDPLKFADILKKDIGVNAKYKEFCLLLFNGNKVPKTELQIGEQGANKEAVLKLLSGGKVAPKDLFMNEEYSEVESFSLDKSDEELAPVLSKLDEDAELVIRLKGLYDWGILVHILSGADYISASKIKIYEQHKEDLKLLKNLTSKYLPKRFSELFRDEKIKSNYVAYINKAENRASQEEFCKFLKSVFTNLKVAEQDKNVYEELMKKLDSNTLCPKQVNSDNRVIPYQVYWVELKRILDNASGYLPFLDEADADGYTNKDKLLSIMEFRIPYFVGPLNRASKNAWLERKAEGKIYPWNFEAMVDYAKSEQAFIKRMTNTCTYLPYAEVLPKQSLLHEKFQVLNEINTLSVHGVRIPVEVKQKLYNELFTSRKKITKKQIADFLLSNNIYTKEDLKTLSGIDDTVKSSLSSQISFSRLLQAKALTTKEVETIIKRATYTENKTRFAKWIDETFPQLTDDDKRYVSNLKFKDFARLSEELLCEVYDGVNEETGEVYSIIDRMWNENVNLMELLSDRFTYRDQIKKQSEEYYREHPKSIDERIKEMYISNSVKRPILRTLDIVADVVKVNGCAPQKIFIEMARGGKPEDKGKRTKTRCQQLKELYAKCDTEDVRRMNQMLDSMGDDRDNRLQSEKLFLYYLQLGKSMYSGKTIDIGHLSDKNKYDIDHIYPQSKVKDDSILNNKVLVLSEENGMKSDKYPIAATIRQNMAEWWKLLLDNGFITTEKYKRLTRHTPFDENEEWGFISRQLVETRQSTKALATLLKEKYPDTEIVYVKAGLVSEFRQEFDLLKSRAVNDLHHAKDAYLNIVVGNVYNEKFTRKWFLENRNEYNLKVKTLFTHPLKLYDGTVVWKGGETLAKVKSIVQNKNAIHLTRYAFCRKGGLFNQMPVAAKADLVPLKKGMPAEKYGGYSDTTASFFALVKYTIGEKRELVLIPIELLVARQFLTDGNFAIRYAKNVIEKLVKKRVDSVTFPIGMRKIKCNTIFDFDGLRMSLASKSNKGRTIVFSVTNSLILGYSYEKYIKRLERYYEKKLKHTDIVYSEEYDKITMQRNEELYQVLIKKLKNTIFSSRPGNPCDVLTNGTEAFKALDINDQVRTLLQIITLFGRSTTGCDLSAVGGRSKGSVATLSWALSNWKKNYSNVCIIDSSASGLFEKRSENLLDLL